MFDNKSLNTMQLSMGLILEFAVGISQLDEHLQVLKMSWFDLKNLWTWFEWSPNLTWQFLNSMLICGHVGMQSVLGNLWDCCIRDVNLWTWIHNTDMRIWSWICTYLWNMCGSFNLSLCRLDVAVVQLLVYFWTRCPLNWIDNLDIRISVWTWGSWISCGHPKMWLSKLNKLWASNTCLCGHNPELANQTSPKQWHHITSR